MMKHFVNTQRLICDKYGSPYLVAHLDHKVGIAISTLAGGGPINGLRHPVVGDTSGWYIWRGENFSTDEDFFVPMHIEHLHNDFPMIIKYLGLAPGWRFLIAENYEDVWEDRTLSEI